MITTLTSTHTNDSFYIYDIYLDFYKTCDFCTLSFVYFLNFYYYLFSSLFFGAFYHN